MDDQYLKTRGAQHQPAATPAAAQVPQHALRRPNRSIPRTSTASAPFDSASTWHHSMSSAST